MRTLRCILVLMFLISSNLLATRDMVTFKSGKEVEVLITKEDSKEIRFKDLQTGASQKVPVEKIQTIFYEDAPPIYREAIASLQAGSPDVALKSLVSLVRQGLPKTRLPWVKNYVSFYTAKSLAMWARKSNKESAPKLLEKAKSQLLKFEKTYASSRFIPESIYLRGMCELKAGRYDGGRKILTDLSKKGDWPYWVAKAQAGIGESYLLEKDFETAEKHCVKQLKAGRFSGEVVEILSVILIDKKMDAKKALAFGKKLIGRGDRDVERAAHEMVGAAHVLLKNFEDGLMALLRSRFLYSDSKTHGSRNNIYTAMAIKQLIDSKPESYPGWDYNPKFASLYRALRSSEKKVYSKIQKSFK